jgi:hypothetical protein
MFRIDDRASRAGWISLRVIGAIAAAIVAMTCDARVDGRRDARDALHTDSLAAGPWCVLDRDSGRNCRYVTFDQCLKAAAPLGVACRPDPAMVLIADDGPYRTYRAIYPDHSGQGL